MKNAFPSLFTRLARGRSVVGMGSPLQYSAQGPTPKHRRPSRGSFASRGERSSTTLAASPDSSFTPTNTISEIKRPRSKPRPFYHLHSPILLIIPNPTPMLVYKCLLTFSRIITTSPHLPFFFNSHTPLA
ncbi:unnamed protein product [Diplocarpon coronariae]